MCRSCFSKRLTGFNEPFRSRVIIWVNDQIIIGRELTKFRRVGRRVMPTSSWLELPAARGEFVLVVPPARPVSASVAAILTDAEISHVFGQITDNTALSRREAIRRTGEELRLAPKAVYAALERHKISGK